MLDWDDYRIFLTVARTPSIRTAALELQISHSTVLRRLDRLEDKLGARLFERRNVGFRLTPAGEDVYQGVCEIEESVQGIDRSVTGRDSVLEGVVKVTMPDVFGHPALFPDLSKFNERFPLIQLDVDLSYSYADLGKREADIALRITNAPSDDLVGRKIGSAHMANYATQAYIGKHRPFEAKSQAKVIASGNPDTWSPRPELDHLTAIGYFDNMLLRVTLACQGVGIAYLPTPVGDYEANLIRLTEPVPVADAWLLYHTDLRYTSRVRAVRDFLQESLTSLFKADDR
jgi:DNA-binding transcriptional LysR family regulator